MDVGSIYPAHAGINLEAQDGWPIGKDLPRTCGDKPGELDLAQIGLTSTPHMRG